MIESDILFNILTMMLTIINGLQIRTQSQGSIHTSFWGFFAQKEWSLLYTSNKQSAKSANKGELELWQELLWLSQLSELSIRCRLLRVWSYVFSSWLSSAPKEWKGNNFPQCSIFEIKQISKRKRQKRALKRWRQNWWWRTKWTQW